MRRRRGREGSSRTSYVLRVRGDADSPTYGPSSGAVSHVASVSGWGQSKPTPTPLTPTPLTLTPLTLTPAESLGAPAGSFNRAGHSTHHAPTSCPHPSPHQRTTPPG